MINESKFSQVCYFYAYAGIHQVRETVSRAFKLTFCQDVLDDVELLGRGLTTALSESLGLR